MKHTNWDNFDGALFQKLCNAILLFTVSKFAHVFIEAGKDGGVDQAYSGTHDGKTGKWRFQDKFHHSGNQSADISELKRDIATDIKTNYKDENFIVIFTNVSLSPQKLKECLKIATDTLAEKGITNCEAIIWHGGHIETLLSTLPIIYNWFWERNAILLQTYDQYFAKQLEESPELRNQLFNPFFGREAELESMKRFLANPSATSLAVVANGGYGKTRLTIEFIKTYIDQSDEWIALVLSHVGFNPSYFNTLLQSLKQLLIIIDDAHEIPDITAEVKRMVDNTKGKAKLLITTRPALFAEIQNKIPSHIQQPEKLILEKLEYEKTKLMFSNALPRLTEKNILYLTQVSKGVPNVILELIRLVRAGKQPQEISAEGVFSTSVMEIYRQAISDVEKKTTISQTKSFDFLRIVSLISPVTNNAADRTFIAETIEIREDQLELLIAEFQALNLLEASSVISVKPDPYSDVLVMETFTKAKSFIKHILNKEGSEAYIENMLKNLMEAEISGAEKNLFIDGFLLGYLQLLDEPATGAKKIKDIFSFVESIALYKPATAIQIVNKFLDWQADPTHAVHQMFVPWATGPFVAALKELAQNILKKLCTYSDYPRKHKDEIHALVERFAMQTGDFKIVTFCYGYHEWDFPYGGYRVKHCSERQLYLKSKVCTYLADPNATDFQIEFSLSGAHLLLKQEYQLDTYFDSITMQMHYGHGYVPDCKHTKEIHMDIINALIAFMESPTASVHKERVFTQLLGEIFFCAKGYGRRHKQDLTAEIELVLTFFDRFLDQNPASHHKNAIRTKIMVYEKGEYKDEYRDRMMILKEKAAAASSLSQELELHLLNDDYFDAREHLEKRVLTLIPKYSSFLEFQKDLLHLRLGLGAKQSNFGSILNMIGRHYPAEAKGFFTQLQNNNPDLMGEALGLITPFYKERDYFYSVVDWLWHRKDNYLHMLMWIISWGRDRDRNSYELQDLAYYAHLIKEKLTTGNSCDVIVYNLINYAYLDREQTFKLLNEFLSYAPANDMQHLQFTLFDNNATYEADFKEEIKTLYYTNPHAIDLEHGLNNGILRFFDTQFGFEEVFSFVLHWLDSNLAKTEYHYFHFDQKYYSNKAATKAEEISRYKTLLRWYITPGNDAQKEQKAEAVLTLFRPDTNITDEIRAELLPLIEEYKDNAEALHLLAEGLQTFSNGSEAWVLLLANVADALVATGKDNVDFSGIFGNEFTYNYGSKSKQGRGIPYVEDESKKELLEKVLAENKFSEPVQTFLSNVLKKVNQDIAEEIENDKLKSEW